MDLLKSIAVSASGMRVQGERMRIISENLANKDSVARSPNEEPYRRKTISFKTEIDKQTNANTVVVNKIDTDDSEFDLRFDPSHPAADKDGYIKLPNVNALVEIMDMKETQRSYQANLGVIDASKSMIMTTLDLLR
jgi:flagellar basal-body rod protein FlgC